MLNGIVVDYSMISISSIAIIVIVEIILLSWYEPNTTDQPTLIHHVLGVNHFTTEIRWIWPAMRIRIMQKYINSASWTYQKHFLDHLKMIWYMYYLLVVLWNMFSSELLTYRSVAWEGKSQVIAKMSILCIGTT